MSKFVTLAKGLLPLICELRHATEQDRRIAEPIVQAIRESGLCRMLLDTGAPPACAPEEWLTVLETLAGAEASVSWLVWNNTLPCFWSRFLNDAGRERVFGDPAQLFAGSTRPTGRAVTTGGGSRLSGRWSLVSGCELADHLHLMSLVYEDGVPRMLAPGQPDLRVLFVPKGSYEILDTWHVGGLRGSGSHDVVADDVFVPDEASFSPAPPVAGNSQLAQLPIVPVMIAGIGAQFLGMARAATAVTIEILRDKVSVDPGASIRERPGVLADIASCSAAVAAAGSHLHARWRRCGTRRETMFRHPRTVRRFTAPACTQPPSRAQASRPCTPPPVRLRSTSTVRWNGACAICKRWSGILLRNHCGWRTRAESF
jgi:alkylation response protein AidB-like acyl-CoA dehydrogenase